MAKVTFTARTWVWFEVWGEQTEQYGWREDGGLVAKFLTWMSAQKIDWRSQRSGGGAWVGRIPVEDAARVATWLKRHGAEAREAT